MTEAIPAFQLFIYVCVLSINFNVIRQAYEY